METVVLKVEGMSCGHCKASVEKALKGLNGVGNATVNLEAKNVTVEYDGSAVNVEAMQKAIEDVGYEVVN
ncbi:MAG: copper chaperone CopZ [Clostridia bacterium]|nr:copper chaperone CopZ [Clostridia bacterium]